jgi:glycosyltransferase involved in cell wall biosynthesis
MDRVLEGADVLVLHSAWSPHNNVAAAAARRRGVPYVLEPRGEYDPNVVARAPMRKRAWLLATERALIARAGAVHLFFRSQGANVEALGYRGPFVVAPNGVEVPAGVRWDGGGGYVVWLGRFDPEHKGLDLLVRAVASLPRHERLTVRLHGPDRRGGKRRTCALIASLGVGEWVQVGDPVYGDAKWDLLSSAAAFVYPSRWEGFGNAVAEAAAIGVPCLTTPYPLGRALAERGGALVVDATPATIADGLCKITSSGAESFGEAGARYAAEELRWDHVTRRWLDQLEALLR